MAKKVVATLKKEGGVNLTKAIRVVRSPKNGAYTFEERILPKEMVKDFLKD